MEFSICCGEREAGKFIDMVFHLAENPAICTPDYRPTATWFTPNCPLIRARKSKQIMFQKCLPIAFKGHLWVYNKYRILASREGTEMNILVERILASSIELCEEGK